MAYLIDPGSITPIFCHTGEPRSPPLRHPAREPPQTNLDMGAADGEAEEVAQDSFPDDLNQTPEFDPTEPEPIPEHDFDQTRGAGSLGPRQASEGALQKAGMMSPESLYSCHVRRSRPGPHT